jgi:hypothetical protein
MMTNNLSDFITEMKLSTQVEKGQTEFESCIYSGRLLSWILLKTKGGLLLGHISMVLVEKIEKKITRTIVLFSSTTYFKTR